jgi:hypothetical protein
MPASCQSPTTVALLHRVGWPHMWLAHSTSPATSATCRGGSAMGGAARRGARGSLAAAGTLGGHRIGNLVWVDAGGGHARRRTWPNGAEPAATTGCLTPRTCQSRSPQVVVRLQVWHRSGHQGAEGAALFRGLGRGPQACHSRRQRLIQRWRREASVPRRRVVSCWSRPPRLVSEWRGPGRRAPRCVWRVLPPPWVPGSAAHRPGPRLRSRPP